MQGRPVTLPATNPADRCAGARVRLGLSHQHGPHVKEFLEEKRRERGTNSAAEQDEAARGLWALGPHLLLGHVQEAHRVPVTVQIGPYSVEGLVKLPLDVCQLLKHLVGRPQQHLGGTHRCVRGHTRPSAQQHLGEGCHPETRTCTHAQGARDADSVASPGVSAGCRARGLIQYVALGSLPQGPRKLLGR